MKEPKEIIKFWGLEIHIYLDDRDTSNLLSLFKVVAYPSSKMGVPHYHEHFDETVFGLKGTTTYVVDGQKTEVGVGDYFFVPRGAVHAFSNQGTDNSEFLTIINPGTFGATYFREMAEVINVAGPPDMAKLKSIMLSHGLVLVIPEPAS